MVSKRTICSLCAALLLTGIAWAAKSGRDNTPQSAIVSGISRVAFTDLPHGWPVHVLPIGNQVLLSNGETFRGLQRIDWRNPDKPQLAQSFDTGNTNGSLVKLGSRVFQLADYYGISMFDIDKDGVLHPAGHWRMPPPANHGRKMVGLRQNGHDYLYLHIMAEGDWKDWPPRPTSPEPGLYLLDVTDSSRILVRNLGKRPMFSEISGEYGFVRGAFTLEIYSLKTPAFPRLLGSYQTRDKIRALHVDGAHAWLFIGGRTLEALDISDPAHPFMLAHYQTAKAIRAPSIAARDAWAYVLDGGNAAGGHDDGLHIFHLQDGLLNHVRHVKWPHTDLTAMVMANRSIAYLLDNNYGVRRLDLSRPAQPDLTALFMSAGEVQQLLVDGSLALANLEWGGSVAILDASDPMHIRIRGYYRPGRFDDYAVAVIRPYFYFGKGSLRHIINAGDATHPVEVGIWKLPGRPLMPPIRHKDKAHDYMFQWLQNSQGVRLAAYDMHDPAHPNPVATLTMPKKLSLNFGASAADDQHLFAVADNTVVAIDISHPSEMHLLGAFHETGIGRKARYTWQGAGRRATLAEDSLYILQGSESMDAPHIAVLDVADPKHMRHVFTTPETPPTFEDDWFDSRLLHQGDMLNDIIARDHRLYVSDYWGGLRIYSLHDPFRPQLVSWEFSPYLSLMPKDWSRKRYQQAVASGDIHQALGLDDKEWRRRMDIGNHIWNRKLAYHPGYDLYGWNVGDFVNDYLLQPKLGGIAVYHFPTEPRQHLP